LVKGFQKEFFSGNPTPGTPNAITGVFKLLSSILGGGGFGFGGIGDLISAVMGGMNPLAANALPAPTAKTVTVSTESSAGNDGGSAPIVESEAPPADETDADEPEKTATTKTSSSSSTPKPAGPSASPKPTSPVGSVIGGVTNTVGGVTGGVTNTVGGVTGGVTNTVGGVTGGVTNTVGGVTGGLSGALSGLKPKTSTSSGTG
jgi:hypothetical protein